LSGHRFQFISYIRLLLIRIFVEKFKGFAFVEFEDSEDAFEAIENLNKAEFYGRVLTVNFAKPDAIAKNRASAIPRVDSL